MLELQQYCTPSLECSVRLEKGHKSGHKTRSYCTCILGGCMWWTIWQILLPECGWISHILMQRVNWCHVLQPLTCCSWTLLCLGGNSWAKWHLTIACICLLSNIVVALCNPLRQNLHTWLWKLTKFLKQTLENPKTLENAQNNTHVHCITIIRNIWA